MIKKILLSISLLTTSALVANGENQQLLKDFTQEQFKNRGIVIKNLKISDGKVLGKEWQSYHVEFDVKENGKFVHTKELLIMNGNYLVSDALNLKTMTSLRDSLKPKFNKDIYDNDFLISGTGEAENKIVVFSDPFCPFCKELMKNIYAEIKKSKKKNDVDVYLYEIALPAHPASDLVIRHIMASKDKKEAVKKIYNSKEDKDITSSTNFDIINNWFEATTDEKIKKEQVFSDEIDQKMQKMKNIANMQDVEGTPAIYVNGEFTKFYSKIEELFK